MLLHPLMLAWIAGAAVPLVLHLLSRSTYRAVPWGAMMFLTGIDAGPQYSAHFKQWTLLLLRMGLIGLLAVALARPVIASRYAWVPTAGLVTGGPAAVVIILDDSASMAYEVNGKSRLDQGRQVTLQILSSLKRGDEAALLLSGSREYRPAIPPNADLQSTAGRVADLQPGTGQCDFAADLFRAADLLENDTSGEHEIYIICDKQALSWRNLNDDFRRRWNTPGSPRPKLIVIPVGGDESDNVAVDAVEIPDHAVIRNEPATARINIHNYGPTPVSSVPVSVWTGTQALAETTITVPAHAIRTVTVPIRFGDDGSRVLSAAVHSNGLATDDRLDCSVDVFEEPRALIINGNDGTAASRPTDNLSSLLWQGRTEEAQARTVKTISIREFNSEVLKQCNQIILYDAAQFSIDQMNDLKSFVRGGGDILLLPGDWATADQYNDGLCSAAGLFPAQVSSAGSKPAHLANFDHQHPIFHFLADRANLLSKTSIARFFPIVTHGSDVHTLARYNNGQPFLLESMMDRGHVLFLTATLDRNSPAEANLVQSIVRYFAINTAIDRNLAIGQSINAMTFDPVEDRSATVQYLSGGQRELADIRHLPDRTEIHFSKTNLPGIYRLRYRTAGKEKVLNYVVSTSRSDSDLAPLTQEQWKLLSNQVNLHRVDLTQTTVAQAMDLQRGGREIWIELLGGVLVLMMLEMILSRWWSV